MFRRARPAIRRVPQAIDAHLLDRTRVLAQRVVDGKSNEISACAPLPNGIDITVNGIDITGVIITAEALHTQREHAGYLRGRGAHYLFTVKGNQPKRRAQLRGLPQGVVIRHSAPEVRPADAQIGQ